MPHFGLTAFVPYVLYGIAILVLLASLFWRPEIGLYFIVPLFPLQTIRYSIIRFPLGNKLIDLILLSVLLGLLFRRGHRSFSNIALSGFVLLFGLFLYMSLVRGSLLLGTGFPPSLDDPRFSTWKNYMIMPLAFTISVAAINNVKQVRILIFLMCFGALLANKSIYSNVADRNLSHFSYEIRDGGTFGYAGANGAGAFDAWFVVLMLALYAYEQRRWLRLALLAASGFSVYCLMLTFSRGAYIGFLLGMIVLSVLKTRKFLLILIPFLLTWEVFVPPSVSERINMTYTESGSELDASSAERIALWEDARALFSESPILGSGFDTYAYIHRASVYVGNIELKDTHNYYLKVIVETGVVGLGLFLLLLGRMVHLSWRLFRSGVDPFLKSIGLGAASGIVALAVANVFGDRWQYIQITGYLWVVVACVVRGLTITEEARKSLEKPGSEELNLREAPARA